MSDLDDETPEYEQTADQQLYPTTGPGTGLGKDQTRAADGQTRRVLEEIRVPDQREAPVGEVPIRADGSRPELPPLSLPGFGSRLEDCGDDLPLFCEDCGFTNVVGRTCKRSECPRCGAAWVRDRAVNVASRLAAARAMRDASREKQQRFHHLAICPPDDWYLEADDVLGATFQVIRGILEQMDLEGYVFYHPWSGKNGLEDKSREAADGEDGAEWFGGPDGDDGDRDDDRGAWKHRLFNDRDWSDVSEELQLRQHFHVVAVGHKVPGGQLTSDVYDATGWVMKRITKSPDSNVSLYDQLDMARAVSYCISHTGIDTSGASNRVQYRKYGSALNQADVYDRTRREVSKQVRKVAPKVLGVDLEGQLCTTERIKPPDSDGDDGPAAASILAGAGSMAGQDGGDPFELPGGSEMPDEPVGPDATVRKDVEEIEPEPCEGRMLHIKQAEEYLEDDAWLERADNAEVLQTTWDEWADRLDELAGG